MEDDNQQHDGEQGEVNALSKADAVCFVCEKRDTTKTNAETRPYRDKDRLAGDQPVLIVINQVIELLNVVYPRGMEMEVVKRREMETWPT